MRRNPQRHPGIRNVYVSRHVHFGALIVHRLWFVPRLPNVSPDALME